MVITSVSYTEQKHYVLDHFQFVSHRKETGNKQKTNDIRRIFK